MQQQNSLLRLLTPSWISFVICTFAAVMILVTSNFTSLINGILLSNRDPGISSQFHIYVNRFLNPVDQIPWSGQLMVMLFWAGIGAATYLVIWLIWNAIISVRTDVEAGWFFTNQSRQEKKNYWLGLAARSSLRLGAVLVILALSILAINVWYPLSVTLFRHWIENWHDLKPWLSAFEAFVAWLFIFHLLTVCLRLVLLRVRIFGG